MYRDTVWFREEIEVKRAKFLTNCEAGLQGAPPSRFGPLSTFSPHHSRFQWWTQFNRPASRYTPTLTIHLMKWRT